MVHLRWVCAFVGLSTRRDRRQALLALLSRATLSLQDIEILRRETPECMHQQRMEMKCAAREVKTPVRVLVSSTEVRAPEDDPMLSWKTRHAAMC